MGRERVFYRYLPQKHPFSHGVKALVNRSLGEHFRPILAEKFYLFTSVCLQPQSSRTPASSVIPAWLLNHT